MSLVGQDRMPDISILKLYLKIMIMVFFSLTSADWIIIFMLKNDFLKKLEQ